MGIPPNTSVGASNTPSSEATLPAGSEVTNHPSAAQPPVNDPVQTFRSVLVPAADALGAALPQENPPNGKPTTGVSSRRLRAIPLLSQLLARYPNLSADHTADDIDTPMAFAASCTVVSRVCVNANAKVLNAARVRQRTAWTISSEVYAAAKKKAAGDANIARDLAPIQAILANGPRTKTAPVTAAKAQTEATVANTRATKANQKSTAKTAAATALQHGTGGATVVQPAPTAPAATPGTPGSTPIR